MARAIHVFRTPDRFVAGTVGQPGNRTFYLQAVHDKRVISVILEKQQVAVLAERIAALLLEINRRFGTPIPPESGDIEDLSPLVTPVDAEFQVNSYTPGAQFRPVVAADSAGNFVAVWVLHAYSIQGRRFDATGTPLGPDFQISTYSPNSPQHPAVAVDHQQS